MTKSAARDPYRTAAPRGETYVSEGGIPIMTFFARAAAPRVRVQMFQQLTRAVMPYRICVAETSAPYFRLLSLADSSSDMSMIGSPPGEGIDGRAFPYLPPSDRNVVAPWRNVHNRVLEQGAAVVVVLLNASNEPRDVELVLYGEFVAREGDGR